MFTAKKCDIYLHQTSLFPPYSKSKKGFHLREHITMNFECFPEYFNLDLFKSRINCCYLATLAYNPHFLPHSLPFILNSHRYHFGCNTHEHFTG